MLNVKISVADNQVKIYLNEIIHLLIKQDQLVGIQSWTTGEEYRASASARGRRTTRAR